MDTIYHAYQEIPLAHDMQANDAYAPDPAVNIRSEDPFSTNTHNSLSQTNWGQWWSLTEDVSFAGSTSNVFTQQESQCNHTYNPEISTQWDSSVTFTNNYSVPSQATEPSSLEVPVGDTESRRDFSSTESDKRNRSTTKPTASKPTRRASTRAMKQNAALKKPKERGSKPKPASQPREQSVPRSNAELDKYSKKTKERNRIASNKFRVKKLEDLKKLQANEENVKQINRKLLGSVFDLTQEVHELKMKLLQHTHCDCYLIQAYIAKEANRYIHGSRDDRKHQIITPITYDGEATN
ncbi:hypothetical protein FACUT_9402 [Fusarium acutatum]|uniref:BZIP domain-containing protein n=1 Tax=Fusarium acutatum TaxID=78861 RepID=A0A8H4NGY0_9HYPO|nr:hypothetical protein FACUT_9402 [Fusarium acutatum]